LSGTSFAYSGTRRRRRTSKDEEEQEHEKEGNNHDGRIGEYKDVATTVMVGMTCDDGDGGNGVVDGADHADDDQDD
jgi:hypothetical protein